MEKRVVGIDLGAEAIKVVEMITGKDRLTIVNRYLVEHRKLPQEALLKVLQDLDWSTINGAAVTGRLSRLINLDRLPIKAAQSLGFKYLYPKIKEATLVSIGSHGFSVLEMHSSDNQIFRENSRCSQGTGNFLRQLVERFNISISEAGQLCKDIRDPAQLSGRCPVILKTDMTHLANKGEDRSRILAGLFDAICENVQVLIKPKLAPKDVYLTGGVSRSERICSNFKDFFANKDMQLIEAGSEKLLFVEATGAAFHAAHNVLQKVSLKELFNTKNEFTFELIPALKESMNGINRLPKVTMELDEQSHQIILGLDVGSTGTKLVALDSVGNYPIWEDYCDTEGNPIVASQRLIHNFLQNAHDQHKVIAFGVTGSGREIVGSLLSSCYDSKQVFILNEIAAHSEGALYFDPGVDTIFEIGGQDAKYIRLDNQKVCDAAMNEACSAGTGSFIEEQGKKFSLVENVVQMGDLALESESGVSLGQHCSVFMAEIIDSAVAAKIDQKTIISGIYDSIIQNYLNRVKGTRSIGNKIFCQGMPFSSDALAAAVVRQTGRKVVVPPNPGTVGALGICLLACKELNWKTMDYVNIERFLTADIVEKDSFKCPSTKGCGGLGNMCDIERLSTLVNKKYQKFLWGGNCSLYDNGANKKKLPDLAPDPFRERAKLINNLIEENTIPPDNAPTIAITDEFVLKSQFPFFVTYLRALGFNTLIIENGGQEQLKRGIEESNVALCAPMQLYSGIISELIQLKPDYLFLPMVRDLPRNKEELVSTTCPLSQASRDILRVNLKDSVIKIIDPVLDMGIGNLDSELFRKSCFNLAQMLGRIDNKEEKAFQKAHATQLSFNNQIKNIGEKVLTFAKNNDIIPVIVLGRTYTIYNKVLNSNVPDLLRGQGVMPIPVDCYTPLGDTPIFNDIYWGYSQINLQAAHSVRRTPGLYSIYCSNYSCGPDSFNLAFYSYIMENKPFSIIETDGHSGDAGTKTRIEAFLYCVAADMKNQHNSSYNSTNELREIEHNSSSLDDVKKRNDILLFPRMGEGAELIAAACRAEGIRAEALPMPTRDSVTYGRKYTSGKECVPMTVTMGSVLERLELNPNEKYSIFMPTACGPCRFGSYNMLHKIIYKKLGLKNVHVISQSDEDYLNGVSKGFALRLFAAIIAHDLIDAMLHDVRPVEKSEGAASDLYDKYFDQIIKILEKTPAPDLKLGLLSLTGDLFGFTSLIKNAAAEFVTIKDFSKDVPSVSFVGEIYVRCDPFTNDFLIDKLEQSGIQVRFAPLNEWLEYTDWCNIRMRNEGRRNPDASRFAMTFETTVKKIITNRLYNIVEDKLIIPARTTTDDSIKAANKYLRGDLIGEAVLTLGGPLYEFSEGLTQGVVSVGPFECMPSKIAEAQFYHAAQELGIIVFAAYTNGDPIDIEQVDNFIYEIKSKYTSNKSEQNQKDTIKISKQSDSIDSQTPYQTDVPADILAHSYYGNMMNKVRTGISRLTQKILK